VRKIGYALSASLLALSLTTIGASAHDGGGPPTPPAGGSTTPPASGTTAAPASQVDPQAKAFYDQGESYSKQKNWDQAIGAYQQAVRIDPKYAEAWNNMGFCYRKVKQYDKALDAYKQAMALKPNLPNPHEYLGRTYLEMGNKDGAMREYEILKRMDPKMADELLKAIQANDPDLGEND